MLRYCGVGDLKLCVRTLIMMVYFSKTPRYMLALMIRGKDRERQHTSNIKMGMQAEGHTCYGGFRTKENVQNPFISVEKSRTVTFIMVNHCLKVLREKASTSARRITKGCRQCIK